MIHTARAKSKFKKLVRLLREELPTGFPIDVETIAIGILERLWHTTATDAFRGDIGKLSDDEIAESVGWFGKADSIVAILIESRWIDAHGECRLIVHDWAEHAPRWVHGNAAKYGGFFSPVGASYKEPPIGASLRESPPNLTKPSLTKPNLTKPSQAKPSLAGDCVAGLADLSFLALAGDRMPDVVRQAKAIDKAFPRQFADADEIFAFAWVSLATREGFIPEMIEKFKRLQGSEKAVRAPKKWILGSLRKELQPLGVDLEEAFAVARTMFKKSDSSATEAQDCSVGSSRTLSISQGASK